MSQVIRIPANTYSRLEKHAKGFDTPANVIEKLFDHYEGIDQTLTQKQIIQTFSKNRDTKKYNFNKKNYGKGRLVLAVVKEYIFNNPKLHSMSY